MQKNLTPLSEDILDKWQVRKTKKQKKAFRDFLTERLTALDCFPFVESGGSVVKSNNIVVGDVEKASIIFTAHYDTCACMPIPNFIIPRNIPVFVLYQIVLAVLLFGISLVIPIVVFALASKFWLSYFLFLICLFIVMYMLVAGKANLHTANDNTSGVITLVELIQAMPSELRGNTAFVFFDNEELGLFGSSLFKSMHGKDIRETPLVNFDCVSDGDNMMVLLPRRIRRNAAASEMFRAAFMDSGSKKAMVVSDGGTIYPSDQAHFAYGVGVAALKHSRVFGYYMDKIHTKKDVVFDRQNIKYLTDASIGLLLRVCKK